MPRKRAELRLVVHVGSLYEDDDQQGLAHLLEHMAFNGSTHFPDQALVSTLEALGMAFGHHTNASTSTDSTVYKLQIPTDDPHALDTGFRVLQDWAGSLTLDTAAIERERGVVLEEWRRSRGAGGRIRDALWTSLWQGSRYGERQPIGTEESLRTFDPDAVRRLYRDWYRPDNMAVVAVGDFDPADIQARIEAAFGSLPLPAQRRAAPQVAPPDAGDRVVIVADPEITASSVTLRNLRPDREDPTVTGYRRKVLEGLIQGVWRERCEALSLGAKTRMLRCGGGTQRMTPGFKLDYATCTTADEHLLGGLEDLLEELERFRRHGVTPSELERRKLATASRYEGFYNRRDDTDSTTLVNELVRATTTGESVPGIANEHALVAVLLPTLTLDEVNAQAAAWLAPGQRHFAVHLPAREGLSVPTRDQVLAHAAAAQARPLAAPLDDAATGPLVGDLPAAGRVVARRDLPELGVQVWTLDNGAEAWLKQTDFKPDQVLVRAFSPGGLATAADALHVPATAAAGIRRRSGLGRWDPAALIRRLQGTRMSFRPTLDRHSEGVTGSASPAFLEPVLQLAWLNATAPRFEPSAMDAWREATLAAVRNRANNPETALKDAYVRQMWSNHLRFRDWDESQLGQLDLAESEAFYRHRFSDAARFTWFFVGDFDPEALEPLLTATIGALPSESGEGGPGDDGAVRTSGRREETVYAGLEPKARLRWRFHGPFADPVENRVRLYALRDVLDVLLREEIREKRGGAYAISVGAQASSVLDEYTLTIDFSCDPDRLTELEDATTAVLRGVQDQGLTAAVVEAEKEMNRRGYQVELRTNTFWRSLLANAVATLEDPADLVHGFDRRNDALTPESLQDAARTWLDFDRYVKVRLLPRDHGPSGD